MLLCDLIQTNVISVVTFLLLQHILMSTFTCVSRYNTSGRSWVLGCDQPGVGHVFRGTAPVSDQPGSPYPSAWPQSDASLPRQDTGNPTLKTNSTPTPIFPRCPPSSIPSTYGRFMRSHWFTSWSFTFSPHFFPCMRVIKKKPWVTLVCPTDPGQPHQHRSQPRMEGQAIVPTG